MATFWALYSNVKIARLWVSTASHHSFAARGPHHLEFLGLMVYTPAVIAASRYALDARSSMIERSD